VALFWVRFRSQINLRLQGADHFLSVIHYGYGFMKRVRVFSWFRAFRRDMMNCGSPGAGFKRFGQLFDGFGRNREIRFGFHRDRALRASGSAHAAPETQIGIDDLCVILIH
jgi:hypothetical protein